MEPIHNLGATSSNSFGLEEAENSRNQYESEALNSYRLRQIIESKRKKSVKKIIKTDSDECDEDSFKEQQVLKESPGPGHYLGSEMISSFRGQKKSA